MLTINKRKKRSKIWDLPDHEFEKLIAESTSIKVALSFFNLQNKGNNFKTIKARINEMGLDTSHFLNNVDASNLTRQMTKEKFEKNWLVENIERNRTCIKKYLIKFKMLEYECFKCKNNGDWLGQPITLQLEHINGISIDNRLSNLCFLCPNCHSQTSTFAGRKNKKNKQIRIPNYKIIWPDEETLKNLLWTKPTTHIAKDLGVSDKAVEKHIKKLKLSKPPRGYWGKAASVGIEP
jgi:hypothetical protein